MKKVSKRVWAVLLSLAMICAVIFLPCGASAFDEGVKSVDHPVISPTDGKVLWDCIYFGNYWQSRYNPKNAVEEGQDDVACEDAPDDDGNIPRYIVRSDGSCYLYEPVKWRILSSNEDGTDVFLMADRILDVRPYNDARVEGLTWGDSSLRGWLNDEFLNTVFDEEEQKAIKTTEVENKCNPWAKDEECMIDGNPTGDKLYLLSVEEALNPSYGFTVNPGKTQTRCAGNTDFLVSKGVLFDTDYWLRTMGDRDKDTVSQVSGWLEGMLPIAEQGMGLTTMDEMSGVRPVLHVDLTQTGEWIYAGKVKQDGTVFEPGESDLPEKTAAPEPEKPGVTMAPGQTCPKAPAKNSEGLSTWDCVYFGNYYNHKYVPSALLGSDAGENEIWKDGDTSYGVRREQGYFTYEPMKWRVLSINGDGTDAMLLADKCIDLHPYNAVGDVSITWEQCDLRKWLNDGDNGFLSVAFSGKEQAAVLETEVETSDNPWSMQPGGDKTRDKVYLLSIDEVLNPAYGFSDDRTEGDTRRMSATEFMMAGGTWGPLEPWDYVDTYWLRSPGKEDDCPAVVGTWTGDGSIETEYVTDSDSVLGVRPVIHADLSDTSLWSYAGQVTPKGVVYAPEESSPAETTEPEQTKNPQTNVSAPGRPVIKSVVNKSGKKIKVTLKKKVSGADGYQVSCAKKKNFKGAKTKKFTGTSVTVKGLKKKVKYYVRVRAYKKNGSGNKYGKWSAVKTIKIKK